MPVDVSQLRIILYPDPVLRATALPVESVTDEVLQIATKMLSMMHEAPGVGLAGPQVGLNWRLFVANPTGQPDGDQVFINPVLSQVARQTAQQEEGCLSLPDVCAPIRRPQAVTIEAIGVDGRRFSMTDGGLAARVWQHELDHLDGVLIIDRMAEIDKMANKKTLRDLEKQYARRV